MSSRKKSRRAKQNKYKEFLKYEVYGIIIIVLALISLASGRKISGIGSGGEALTSIFLFISGAHYYIIPILLIYIGLYAMIRRAWPTNWTMRKTGLLIIILGIVTTEHIRMIQQLDPDGTMGIWKIISQPFQNFYEMATQEIDVNEYRRYLGGGMVGAIIYGVLQLLFDRLGSKFVVVALFAIGILCFTGWSYVEMLRRFKSSGSKLMRSLRYRLKQLVFLVRDRTEKRSTSTRAKTEKVDAEADGLYDAERSHSIREIDTETSSYGQDDSDISDPQERTFPRIRDFQDHVDNDQPESVNVPPLPEPLQHIGVEKVERDGEGMERDVHFRSDALPWDYEYLLPPLHLLEKPEQTAKSGKSQNHKANAIKLEETLESFGVRAKVLEVVKGPTVTRYEVQPDAGVKVSRIVSLTDDIALALAAKDIRMEAPIPGKSAIGIEVPNTSVSMVTLREVMESTPFQEADSKVTIALGRDISGMPIVADLAKMPHLLVAGATGSGKSVCINGMIVSILYKAKPNEVKFLMIDPKKVELNGYNGIPHLLAPVVTDPRRASLALRKVVSEMEKRYELFSEKGVRNLEGYNNWVETSGEGEKLPLIVVIVDELADLMMVAANDVEDSICRLAQMARAAGIHLIIATQRPSVNVITGVIKANIPSRIAFGVSSQVDSRTILDTVGAEKLLGRGDMLFLPVGASKPIRTQGAFLSDEEVESVVQYVKAQAVEEYQEELVIPEVDESVETEVEMEDELFDRAVQVVVEAKQASVSLLQRRMRIGYTRAARLIDAMEAKGIVGPYEGSKPREVLISLDDDNSMKNVGS